MKQWAPGAVTASMARASGPFPGVMGFLVLPVLCFHLSFYSCVLRGYGCGGAGFLVEVFGVMFPAVILFPAFNWVVAAWLCAKPEIASRGFLSRLPGCRW